MEWCGVVWCSWWFVVWCRVLVLVCGVGMGCECLFLARDIRMSGADSSGRASLQQLRGQGGTALSSLFPLPLLLALPLSPSLFSLVCSSRWLAGSASIPPFPLLSVRRDQRTWPTASTRARALCIDVQCCTRVRISNARTYVRLSCVVRMRVLLLRMFCSFALCPV